MQEYRIAHMLFSHNEIQDPMVDTSREDALENAQDALQRLQDGEAFEIVASQVSDCPSGAMGGLLGAVQAGEMVQPFESVCFALGVGQVSEIFETEFGYHIAWRYTDDILDETFTSRY